MDIVALVGCGGGGGLVWIAERLRVSSGRVLRCRVVEDIQRGRGGVKAL
jgi:hypothetical protein